jgi:hypothetical protein
MADRVDWQAEPEVERCSAYLRLFAAIPLSKYRLVSPSIVWYRLQKIKNRLAAARNSRIPAKAGSRLGLEQHEQDSNRSGMKMRLL